MLFVYHAGHFSAVKALKTRLSSANSSHSQSNLMVLPPYQHKLHTCLWKVVPGVGEFHRQCKPHTCCWFGCSLRPLFVALNDEAGTVRALAIQVVGRLAGRNPAYVMPALRRHLMQLLSDMDHLPDSRNREGV